MADRTIDRLAISQRIIGLLEAENELLKAVCEIRLKIQALEAERDDLLNEEHRERVSA